jgi:tRNA pseudouridine32 synthase / 23S rRNA pseudouridine746 synthase
MDVLYESSDFIAVDKPENLASIPERRPGSDSVIQLLQRERGEKLFVVHRLDKEVSGVILFARHAEAHRFLNDRFSSREVAKTYLAVLHGQIEGAGGSILRPIREFGSGRMGIDERGKKSETEFAIRERFGRYTLVEAFPHTGRRHQLRVHFYSLGHPVVGDSRYGVKPIQAKCPRLMLHALRISFRLPDGEKLSVRAEPPASFRDSLDLLRREG